MLKQLQVSQTKNVRHRKTEEDKLHEHEVAKKVLNDKVMTIYQPNSDSEIIDVIRNESTMKFMISIMTTSKRVDSFLNYAKDQHRDYQWKQGFHVNSIKFVEYMNAHYVTKDGHRVMVSADLPIGDQDNPGWVASALQKIVDFAIAHNYNVRSFPGLSQLQLRRVFWILMQMKNANSQVAPKFNL